MLTFIRILISTGYLTLAERKVLRFAQLRLGPNKSLVLGLIQPVLDGLKLFKKINILNIKIYFIFYEVICCLIFFISFLLWIIIPISLWSNKTIILLWILLILGLIRFCLLLIGWRSINKYGILGSNRRLAQMLSFEILLRLLVFCSFIIKSKVSWSPKENSALVILILGFLFFITIIIETQRSPIDLSEGERELVRGYNTEFSSIMFVYLFLAE